MRAPSITLDDAKRRVVRRTVFEVCEYREWSLHAINVRTTHVHILVSGDARPEAMMTAFKSWSTRRLREAGAVGSEARVWSRHGSTRYLWDRVSVAGAREYVLHGQ